MKLSERTRDKLYDAISGPIIEQRVALATGNPTVLSPRAVDDRLIGLEAEIWRRVLVVLRRRVDVELDPRAISRPVGAHGDGASTKGAAP